MSVAADSATLSWTRLPTIGMAGTEVFFAGQSTGPHLVSTITKLPARMCNGPTGTTSSACGHSPLRMVFSTTIFGVDTLQRLPVLRRPHPWQTSVGPPRRASLRFRSASPTCPAAATTPAPGRSEIAAPAPAAATLPTPTLHPACTRSP
jgi:hypothetical protein